MASPSSPLARGQKHDLLLSKQMQAELEKWTNSSRRVEADRARILLGLNQGETSSQLASRLGYHPAAIRRIKSQFLQQGIEGMRSRKHTGRTAKKRKMVEEYLWSLEVCGKLQSDEGSPLSAREIAQRVEQHYQISVGLKTVRSALKKRDIDGDALVTASEASATLVSSSG